jgi:hypothetical protein
VTNYLKRENEDASENEHASQKALEVFPAMMIPDERL